MTWPAAVLVVAEVVCATVLVATGFDVAAAGLIAVAAMHGIAAITLPYLEKKK